MELIDAGGFGAAITTKSDLITRDIDVLQFIAQHSPVLCKLTITAADDALAQRIEPGVCPSSARFAALAALSGAGIFCGVLLMPVLPFIEDSLTNVLAIVRMAKQAGARFVYPAFGMTNRPGQREWYYRKLEELFPGQGLAERYRRQYGDAYSCISSRAGELWRAFRAKCDELGLMYDMRDIVRAYTLGYGDRQLSFFKDP